MGLFERYTGRPPPMQSNGPDQTVEKLVSYADVPSISATAARERLSDDVLAHLKSYKYSSVDLSPIANHILRHYVRFVYISC